MSTSKQIIDEALSLPVNDKAELVDQLLSAIDGLDKDIEKNGLQRRKVELMLMKQGSLNQSHWKRFFRNINENQLFRCCAARTR